MQLPTVPLLRKIFPIYGKGRGVCLETLHVLGQRRHQIAVIG